MLPTPVFWPGKFHGLYSPRGRKELDTTERLSLSTPRQKGAVLGPTDHGSSRGGGSRDREGREAPHREYLNEHLGPF